MHCSNIRCQVQILNTEQTARREISHGNARSEKRVCFHSIIAREFPPGVELKLSATKRDGAEAIPALLQLIIAAVFNEYVGKETLAAEK